jgi:hypothetical protein
VSEHLSEHRGGCHCGNLRLSLRLSRAPEDTRLRACGCSFCRAHNTRTTSDPNGSVDIRVADWSRVELYRFGTGTAEFLICDSVSASLGSNPSPPAIQNIILFSITYEIGAAPTGTSRWYI